MNRGLNKVMLIGQLAADPELRYTSAGQAVTAFPLTTPRPNEKDEAGQPVLEWFNIVAWGRLAEICHQLQKGQQIYIEGHLRTHGWQDEQGRRHFRTEVVAHEMVLCEPRPA
ncbi:MAG TPA: single-stranded DNA-binding protein [Anaerolineae bacterium]|nr:single-stranded DNA-binding protein [Anaerolineae bacterium]